MSQKEFIEIVLALVICFAPFSSYAESAVSSKEISALQNRVNMLENDAKKVDGTSKQSERYLDLYDKRIQEIGSNLDKRIQDINSHTDKSIESLRFILSFAAVLLTVFGAMASWIGYKTVSKWIKQTIKDRVNALVSPEYVAQLVGQQSAPVVEKMLADFEAKAKSKLSEIEQQQEKIESQQDALQTRIQKIFEKASAEKPEEKLTPTEQATLDNTAQTADAKPQSERTAEEWQTLADIAYRKDDAQGAYDAIQRALSLGVTAFRLRLAGNIAQDLGSLSEAESFFRRAIEVYPDDILALVRLATFMENVRKDYDQAEMLYQRAIELEPKNAFALNRLAVFMEDVRKDYNQAEALYRRAIEADPIYDFALVRLAVFMEDVRKDYNQAEALYRRAIEAEPKDAYDLTKFGTFMENVRKDYDQAEMLYRRAIEANPKYLFALVRLAMFMENVRKDYNQAEMLYRRAIEADPKKAYVLNKFGTFMENVRKDYDQAEMLYRRAIEAEPKNVYVLNKFGTFMENVRKDYDQAEMIYQRTIEADPTDSYAKQRITELTRKT